MIQKMVETHTDIFPEVAGFGPLHEGYREARKGKRYHEEVLRFSENLESNLLNLSEELESGDYRPKGFKEFEIFDPKHRIIEAPYFRDRVVHRSLHLSLEPVFENTFIYDSFACREGKGTHEGVDRAHYFLRKPENKYYLKCDIRSYFDSIDHSILKEKINRKVKDTRLIGLIDSLLGSYSSDLDDGKGLPIGTLYSQLFANIYLNGFDHFVKQSLQSDFYLRYMDDFVLFSDSKKRLHNLKKSMKGYLSSNLELSLPESKTCIEPVDKGLTFLGYRIFPSHREIRSRNKKKFRRKLSGFKDSSKDFQDVLKSIESWKGHSSHADAENLRRVTLGYLW